MNYKIYKLFYVLVAILNLIWIKNRHLYSIREVLITIIFSFSFLAIGCCIRLIGNTADFCTAMHKMVRIVFIYYCYVLYAVLISKDLVFQRDYGNSLNLIPFRTILQEFNFSLNLLGNLFGNILLFIPLGIMLPVLWGGFKRFYIGVPVICSFSLLVEVVQYCTHSGSSDIDDIILNTIGGFIGLIMYKVVNQIIKIRK